MTHTVVGLFKDRSEAQAAMQELMSSGFIKEDIDLSNRKFAANTDAGQDYFDRQRRSRYRRPHRQFFQLAVRR